MSVEVDGVSHSLVNDIRRELEDPSSWPKEGDDDRVGQDGKWHPAGLATPRRTCDDDPSDPIEAALRCGDAFDQCILHLRRVQAEGDRLAQGAGGKFFNGIRLEDFRTGLNRAVTAVAATRPSQRCGGCDGAGCDRCEQAGWLCPGKQRLY